MTDPFAQRLSHLLEITIQLQASIAELLDGLTKQLEYVTEQEGSAPRRAARRRRSKRS